MDYLGGDDFKRTVLYQPIAPKRRGSGEPPPDCKAPAQGARVRNAIGSTLRLLFVASVFTPSLIGGFVGALVLIFFGDSTTASRIGQGLVVGATISGLFAWTQGIAAELQRRIDLRVQVGLAGDLRRADLVGLDISEVFLRGRQLSGARLSRARLHGGDFSGAQMIDTRMTNGSFFNSVFDQATMIAVGGYGADFRECSFIDAKLSRGILSNADLRSATLDGADLSHADLRGADLRGAVFSDTTIWFGAWYDSRTKWPEDAELPLNHMLELSEVFHDLDHETVDLSTLVREVLAPVVDLRDREDHGVPTRASEQLARVLRGQNDQSV